MASTSERPLTPAELLEIAQTDLLAAAVDLRRGGQRANDSHVLVQRTTWERFVDMRELYRHALDNKVAADDEYQHHVDSPELEDLPAPAEDSGELPANDDGEE